LCIAFASICDGLRTFHQPISTSRLFAKRSNTGQGFGKKAPDLDDYIPEMAEMAYAIEDMMRNLNKQNGEEVAPSGEMERRRKFKWRKGGRTFTRWDYMS
jgi:hypothetical protein